MTTVSDEAQASDRDVTADLAVRAWEQLRTRLGGAGSATPTDAVRLKRQRREWNKTAVYRLEGVGPGGEAVIAKRCLPTTGRVERVVYERILPRVPLPRLRYYGCVEEEREKCCWLFLGDAGSRKPTMADRAAVGEWLARMQAGAATLAGSLPLPDRGPNHFRGLLPRARAGVLKARGVAPPSAFYRDVLQNMADDLDRLESQWDRLLVACESWPRTLVHADFTRKNVRLCSGDEGVHVIALDWETAGCGPPAADLADVPWGRSRDRLPGDERPAPESETPWYGPVCLDAYASTIAAFWPGIARARVEQLSRVGSVFRVIDATCWASHQVEFGGIDKGMCRLQAYADDLRQVVSTLGD